MTSVDLLPHLSLDRASREALHRRIAAAIAAGGLRPGEPPPSTRTLAAAPGVSRNTVVIDEPAAEGWIVACAGPAAKVAGARAPHSNQYSTTTTGRVAATGIALYCGR